MPANLPDHTRRVKIGVQHRFTTSATVVRPYLGLNEPGPIALGPICRRYSVGATLPAGSMAGAVAFALCVRLREPGWHDLRHPLYCHD